MYLFTAMQNFYEITGDSGNMNKNILRVAFKPLTLINKIIPKEDMIFFYSNLGFRDNVKALYDYFIKEGYHKRYKIVVSINDWEQFAKKAPDNVIFINNKEGIKYFLKARYAFYCFGKYPIKPAKSQTVVNLWHGMPLKRIGNMEKGLEKIDYNFFTKIISTAEVFNPILERSFHCLPEQVVIMGQPRNDEMFVENKMLDTAIRRGSRKMILWLPTYREDKQDVPLPGFHEEQVRNLNTFLKNQECRLIVKIHPLQEFSADLGRLSNIEFITQAELSKGGMSVYSLLRAADALITDYSSVFFDYMLLDRPIAFTVEDIKKYQEERGFSFENPLEYMPGPHIENLQQVKKFIVDVVHDRDEYRAERNRVNALVNYYKDGNSAKRIAETFVGK